MELFEYIDIMNQPYDIFCTERADSPMHWHHYSEIIYVHKGAVDIVCNNREITLHAGDLCYFYPLQLHSIKKSTDCPEEVLHSVIKFNIQTLNIPKAYLNPLYDCFVHKAAEDDFCLVVHKDEALENIVQNIVNEYESRKPMHMLAVQAGIHSILVSIARDTGAYKRDSKRQPEHHLSFHHILEYIDEHSAEPLEVNKLAEKCNLSYSHFAKTFRENYGKSCKEYIQYIRLNKAQDLLLNSDFDLDYIAQETGFYDCSDFIRQYKKWRGITPKQERLKMLQL